MFSLRTTTFDALFVPSGVRCYFVEREFCSVPTCVVGGLCEPDRGWWGAGSRVCAGGDPLPHLS